MNKQWSMERNSNLPGAISASTSFQGKGQYFIGFHKNFKLSELFRSKFWSLAFCKRTVTKLSYKNSTVKLNEVRSQSLVDVRRLRIQFRFLVSGFFYDFDHMMTESRHDLELIWAKKKDSSPLRIE